MENTESARTREYSVNVLVPSKVQFQHFFSAVSNALSLCLSSVTTTTTANNEQRRRKIATADSDGNANGEPPESSVSWRGEWRDTLVWLCGQGLRFVDTLLPVICEAGEAKVVNNAMVCYVAGRRWWCDSV